jgi:hypothetical protein
MKYSEEVTLILVLTFNESAWPGLIRYSLKYYINVLLTNIYGQNPRHRN